MKKVLYLITKSNWGGAQRYVYDLATNLPKASYEEVVACGPAQGSTGPGPLLERLVQAGIHTIMIPELTRDVGASEWSAFMSIYRTLKIEHPDVLHLNSSKAGLLGALAGRAAGIHTIIFTAHGWPFQEARNPLWKIMAWAGSVATALLAHRIICVSETDCRALAWLLGRKLITIHNAVADFETLPTDEARAHFDPHGQHAADTWLCSISELNPNKNIHTALNAVAHAIRSGTRVFYVILGDGELRAQLEQEAERLGIRPSVMFAGFIPDARRYLSAFDGLFMPSHKEGLPYAVLEAQAACVPVLGSAVGGIPELVTEAKDGLLCAPDDIECFTRGIPKLRTLPPVTPGAGSFETMIRTTLAHY